VTKEFFPPRPESRPTIYAYQDSNPRYDGQLKVGYTTRTARERLDDIYHIKTSGPKSYKIVLEERRGVRMKQREQLFGEMPERWSLLMFDRIVSNPTILGGKPIVRGTRISVELILEWVASGATRDDILRKHPHLTAADLEQALAYAASAIRNEVLVAAEVGD
jgi:uncharacterized protein (DUF433 family)